MMLSLPSNQSMDNNTVYTLPERTKSIRRSFWRTGRLPLLSSLRRKRSTTQTQSDTASIGTSISTCSSSDGGDNGSYPVSPASSVIHLSDNDDPRPVNITVTPPPQSTTPANHPPPHVFGKAHQGYSMFYLKLPNGNWMVRCRTADRKIIATYEVDGSMV
ncbi:hypothetical protein BCR42DRAFT_409847 [Absidia repens]|uniref:Uncharacterized protein n=1 Tax=Absidia repens TaxID=90262 RepID=A0A1X2IN92_9FUNG|nr:hypothetical protein BCR42DRAFT_409847 [Absidia repens]